MERMVTVLGEVQWNAGRGDELRFNDPRRGGFKPTNERVLSHPVREQRLACRKCASLSRTHAAQLDATHRRQRFVVHLPSAARLAETRVEEGREGRRNRRSWSVVALARYAPPHASTRIRYITHTARNDAQMVMRHGLTGGLTAVHANIEAHGRRVASNNVQTEAFCQENGDTIMMEAVAVVFSDRLPTPPPDLPH